MKSLAITSRSFSKNPILRREVLKLYPGAKFNDDELKLCGDSFVEFLYGYEKLFKTRQSALQQRMVHVTLLLFINN